MNSFGPIDSKNPKGFIKNMNFIHWGLIAGQLIFIALALVIISSFTISTDFENDVFVIISPLISLSAIMGSQVIYKAIMHKSRQPMNLGLKMGYFRTAFLVKIGVLEAASVFSIAIYLINHNLFHLFIAVFVILNMLSFRPGIERFVNDSMPEKDTEM